MDTLTVNPPASTRLLKLTDITTSAGTQIRAKMDVDTVSQYAELMQDSTNRFPSVVVFHDDSSGEYILADGFHRVAAAHRNCFLDIEVEVHNGTRADALKYALGANAAHGLRRTNADKRRSVELALAEWPTLSDRQIAETCAVSNNFVSEQRAQLSSDDSSPPEPRIGKDNKVRRLPLRHAPLPALDVEASITPEPPPSPAQDAPESIGGLNVVHYFALRVEEIVDEALAAKASGPQLRALSLACQAGARRATSAAREAAA